MTRINGLRNIAGTGDFVAWGKKIQDKIVPITMRGNINALIFAAVLIVCSLAVGCSSEKPKTVGSNNQIPAAQTPSPAASMPTPVMQSENKPVAKKPVQHKKPATVNYSDRTYGVTFEYPRRYAIETGNAAADLLTTSPVAMNFVVPGGTALAAVELPETGFSNTDFSSAFFDVSVNKNLTAEQCNQFAVPAPRMAPTTELRTDSPAVAPAAESAKKELKPEATAQVQPEGVSAQSNPETAKAEPSTTTSPATSVPATESHPDNKPEAMPQVQAEPQESKVLLRDMDLHATEAVSGEGTRQSDAKYFHVYQNGACYEFALNVTTVASGDGLIKHVDRDKVFGRLEKILDTVKINPIATPEVTADAPAAAVAGTPAQ